MLRRTGSRLTSCLLIALVVSWCCPRDLAAQQTASQEQPTPLAVKLTVDGRLVGQVMTPGGKPAAEAKVAIGREGRLLAKTSANEEGRFAFKNVKPGQYQIATQHAGAFIECFAVQSAPEEASNGILMSREEIIRRGQQPIANLLHPMLVALVIAAAIAIPIAVHNSDNDSNS